MLIAINISVLDFLQSERFPSSSFLFQTVCLKYLDFYNNSIMKNNQESDTLKQEYGSYCLPEVMHILPKATIESYLFRTTRAAGAGTIW